ncbi:hypothetical protein PG991_008239 [Apiospora marii]|uniref:non-specific serine/threonine protein kinase n=1 Tax=Apiospora marii TaxID=335849 RepID=A0ABR1RSF7_9PEZI
MPRSSTIEPKKASRKETSPRGASPTTLFHLVPTDSISRSALHANMDFVSRARNGEDGIEIGYHVPLEACGRIITRLGRNGDIQLCQFSPQRPMSGIHAYFEYWPRDFQILLINRSRQEDSVHCVPVTTRKGAKPPGDVVIEWAQDYRMTIASYEFLLVWYLTDETQAKLTAARGYEKSVYEVRQRPSNDRPTEYTIGFMDIPFHNTRLNTGNYFRETGPREILKRGSSGIVFKTQGLRNSTDTKHSGARRGGEKQNGRKRPEAKETLEETEGSEIICLAVKVISVQSNHALSQAAVHTEANMMKRFDHANIIKVLFTQNFDTDKPEIVMPLMDGSLEDLIDGGKHFHKKQWLHMGWMVAGQILNALRYLASWGVVHRDIKPANILYRKGRHGRYLFQLADLGLAQHYKSVLEPGGTASYQAPELYPEISGVKCEQDGQGTKMDIYSLCGTLAAFFSQWALFPPSVADPKLAYVEALKCLPEAVKVDEMLKSMAVQNPEHRPSAEELLKNYFEDQDLGIPNEVNSKNWEDSPGDEEEGTNSRPDVEMTDVEREDVEMADADTPPPPDQWLQQPSSFQNRSRRHSSAGPLCRQMESLSLAPNSVNHRISKTPRGATTPRTSFPKAKLTPRATHSMMTRGRKALLEAGLFTIREGVAMS